MYKYICLFNLAKDVDPIIEINLKRCAHLYNHNYNYNFLSSNSVTPTYDIYTINYKFM